MREFLDRNCVEVLEHSQQLWHHQWDTIDNGFTLDLPLTTLELGID